MQQKLSRWEHILRVVAIVALLAGLAAGTHSANAVSTALTNGFVDLAYGAAVDDQPTSVASAESKLWYTADGLWWGALFNGATKQHEIFRYNTDADSWIYTGFALDTRYDSGEVLPPDPTADVDNQFDVLFDANKLYVASRIGVLNAGWTNNVSQYGKLFRYTYNPATKLYTLDAGFPVDISAYRTEVLAIDIEPDLSLWAAWVAHPQSDPESHVFVNLSDAGATGQDNWGSTNGLDLTDVAAIGDAANVSTDDVVTVMTYGTKTGLLWSNDRELTPAPARTTVGKFYFAEHDNTMALNAGWTLTDLSAQFPALTITANDHLRLLSDAAGNLYGMVKTNNQNLGLDMVGVFKRDTLGVWTWTQVTQQGASDTNPTALINETTNNLHVFVASNEGGGLICNYAVPLATMTFTPRNCRAEENSNRKMIYDATGAYDHFNNATTTKQNVTSAVGALVVAGDDTVKVYGHNMLLGPTTAAPDILVVTPVENGLATGAQVIVTARFTEPMNAATINGTTFTVTGPGGAVAGTVTYDATTRTATFASTVGVIPANGEYTAVITNGMRDTTNVALVMGKTWKFTYTYNGNMPPTVTGTTPAEAGLHTGPFLVVTATFSEAMNPVTINPTTFTVSGPGGPVTGVVSYNSATMTATFLSTSPVVDGAYTATVTTGAQDADPTAPMGLAAPKTWTFTFDYVPAAFSIYLPSMFR